MYIDYVIFKLPASGESYIDSGIPTLASGWSAAACAAFTSGRDAPWRAGPGRGGSAAQRSQQSRLNNYPLVAHQMKALDTGGVWPRIATRMVSAKSKSSQSLSPASLSQTYTLRNGKRRIDLKIKTEE